MSAWYDRVGDLTLFEANWGAFDRQNWQHIGKFDRKASEPCLNIDISNVAYSLIPHVSRFLRVIAFVDSTWVFLLLSFYVVISWNMPLFKV